MTGGGDANDDNGHGTAVAGIIAAACPSCSILPVKVLGANGTGDWATIAAGITWAADHGAQVINLSLGAAHAPGVLAGAVSYALSRGVIVVAAAGDDGKDEPFYPAAYPGVVSVTGVDGAGRLYPWSNFGRWTTVAAPGCATTAQLGGGSRSGFCGTSAAAPAVAGMAGLARSRDAALSPAAFASLVASGGPAAATSALGEPLQARPRPAQPSSTRGRGEVVG